LGAALGDSIGRALFGDPEMAAQLALRKAQMDTYAASAEESRAHAGYYGSQTKGQDQMNAASAGLPDLIASLMPKGPVPATMPSDQLAPLPDQPDRSTLSADTFRANIGPVVGALAQMQGDKVNLGETVGSLGAYLGDDEFARRSLVAQGHTPGKEFALTPERADAIAKQGYDADYRKDTAVASINHATDIPVANIGAGADRDVANIQGEASRDVAKAKAKKKGGEQRPIRLTLSAYRMLFGVADDPDEPGELDKQLKQLGWNVSQTAKTAMRTNIIRRYQESGNPIEAVRKTLQLVGLRAAARDAMAKGADRHAVEARFTKMTGQAL
jgi:hypothetical protein